VLKFITRGETKVIHLILLAAQPTVPDTPGGSSSIFLVMGICMVLGIIIAKIGIKNKGKGPSLPLLQPLLGKDFGVPELLAALSIGHILGVGTVLGLTNTGAL
jgi:photosystem I subunit 10